MKVTLDCGCKTPAPKLTSSQVFHNYSRGHLHVAGMLLACPNGHGLKAVK